MVEVTGDSPPDARDLITGRFLRPVPWRTYRTAAWGSVVLYTLDGLVGLVCWLALRDRLRMPAVTLVTAIVTFASAAVLTLLLTVGTRLVRRGAGAFAFLGVNVPGVLVTLVVASFGPSFAVGTGYYAQAAVFAFALLRWPWAMLSVAGVGVQAAVVFAVQDGWRAPVALWLFTVVGVLGISVTAGFLTARVVALADAESRARTELAELAGTLRERVDRQVAQLEHANQLRRFLAPQVADAVLADDHQEVLAAHRQRIAVFFCDLRGFTAFAARVEPEDVLDVLGDYYEQVGPRLRARDATVGNFAGDGIMAYLNDPVPCPDAADTAVAMAVEIRDAMRPVLAGWRRLGYDLGLGIGVAFGHATLGLVGYEGRQDYTALGTVVNLAARLCGAARDQQILIDLRTEGALRTAVATEPVDGVRLKGFPDEMEIRNVVRSGTPPT